MESREEIRQFPRKLVSAYQNKREKALNQFVNWLKKQTDVSDLEMKELWQGLFQDFWMSDKLPNQLQLAEDISSIIPVPSDVTISLKYITCFYWTLRREWGAIDHHRLDKYLKLLIRFTQACFDFLHETSWNLSVVSSFANDALLQEVIPWPALELLLEPFIEYLSLSQDKTMGKLVTKHIFFPIIRPLGTIIDPLLSAQIFETWRECLVAGRSEVFSAEKTDPLIIPEDENGEIHEGDLNTFPPLDSLQIDKEKSTEICNILLGQVDLPEISEDMEENDKPSDNLSPKEQQARRHSERKRRIREKKKNKHRVEAAQEDLHKLQTGEATFSKILKDPLFCIDYADLALVMLMKASIKETTPCGAAAFHRLLQAMERESPTAFQQISDELEKSKEDMGDSEEVNESEEEIPEETENESESEEKPIVKQKRSHSSPNKRQHKPNKQKKHQKHQNKPKKRKQKQ
ncbi:putative ribosomal RNA processing protein 1 like protein [Blattamonas nauphoetae]|uniref:Ribosomal RNA processing protein 1 like protein n=1 Tax=Blattamonas nauphoetae TaxID=2049346 RepID=A0ABQ9Y4S1_9EUKA|nr:putative ribosomal RNA processing protein 1 like protein [Blattamonas nauphoetae]